MYSLYYLHLETVALGSTLVWNPMARKFTNWPRKIKVQIIFFRKRTCFRCRALSCKILGESQIKTSSKQVIFRKITTLLKNPMFPMCLVIQLDAGAHQKLALQFIYPSTRERTLSFLSGTLRVWLSISSKALKPLPSGSHPSSWCKRAWRARGQKFHDLTASHPRHNLCTCLPSLS